MPPARSIGLALALIAIAAPAEAGTLRGRVVDVAGAPIAGAVIDGGGATATSDGDGGFALELAAGAHVLTIYADGFEVTVRRGAPGGKPLRITLSPAAAEVIVVESTAPDQAQPAIRALDGAEIRRLPGAGNDALRALQALPGFARVPFGLGGLVIRGQSPRDTGVFVDGVRVPLAFHFGGLVSFYPSSMLDRLEVTSGAVGAPWGRVGGGLVTLTAERGRTDHWRVGGEIGVLDTSIHADGPTRLGAVTLGVRRSYIDAILAAVLPPEERVLPRYADAQLRLDGGDLTGGGAWTAAIFASDDSLTSGEGESFHLGFARATVGYRRRARGTTVEVSPWLGVDRVAFEDDGLEDDGGGPPLQRLSVPMGVRASLTRDLPRGLIAGGVDVEGGRFGPTTRRVDGPDGNAMSVTSDPRWAADLAVWIEALWRRPDGKLGVRPGLRLDHLGLSDEWALEPHLTVSHELGAWTLRESAALQHQPPVAADLEAPDGNPALDSSRALHAAVAAELALPRDLTLSATVFAIVSDRVPVTVPRDGEPLDEDLLGGTGLGAVIAELFEAQLGSFSYRENRGRGRSGGVELQLHRKVGRVTGWVAYTWSRARRADGRDAPWRPYALDQPHVLTAVASTRIGAWQLGARLRYATGNPTAMVVPDDDPDAPPRLLGYQRLPDFAALDLRVDRGWVRRWGTINLFLDVQNVTNRHNVEDREVVDGETSVVEGLPILPLLGVEYVPI